jgi:hypothetical protein
MAGIEGMVESRTQQAERAQAAQWRMANGARWISSFRRDLSQESQGSLRGEDVARSAVFFDSTCCWV